MFHSGTENASCKKINFLFFKQEINENMKRLQSEKENLQSKLDAERHVLRAQIKDMMEKHMLEMTKVREKYNAELHEIQEKHETELQEKDQALFQLKKQVAELTSSGQTNSKDVADLESTSKEKMEELEGILFKKFLPTKLLCTIHLCTVCQFHLFFK